MNTLSHYLSSKKAHTRTAFVTEIFSVERIRDRSIRQFVEKLEMVRFPLQVIGASVRDTEFNECFFYGFSFTDLSLIGNTFINCLYASVNFFNLHSKENLWIDSELNECSFAVELGKKAFSEENVYQNCTLKKVQFIGEELNFNRYDNCSLQECTWKKLGLRNIHFSGEMRNCVFGTICTTTEDNRTYCQDIDLSGCHIKSNNEGFLFANSEVDGTIYPKGDDYAVPDDPVSSLKSLNKFATDNNMSTSFIRNLSYRMGFLKGRQVFLLDAFRDQRIYKDKYGDLLDILRGTSKIS